MKSIFPLFCLSLLSFSVYSQNLLSFKLTWIYNGKNIYVQNPLSVTDSFCTKEVYVNNKKVNVNLNASAYEINVQEFKLKDTLHIIIIHDKSCKPKILNFTHYPGRSYGYAAFSIDSLQANWTMKGKFNHGSFYLEHFENNNWKTINTISVINISDTIYSLPIQQHSGINKYRVKFIEHTGHVLYSSIVEYESPLLKLNSHFNHKTKLISFQRLSIYELLDDTGEIIKKGESKNIDLSQFKSGTYYLLADNQIHKIKLKTK